MNLEDTERIIKAAKELSPIDAIMDRELSWSSHLDNQHISDEIPLDEDPSLQTPAEVDDNSYEEYYYGHFEDEKPVKTEQNRESENPTMLQSESIERSNFLLSHNTNSINESDSHEAGDSVEAETINKTSAFLETKIKIEVLPQNPENSSRGDEEEKIENNSPQSKRKRKANLIHEERKDLNRGDCIEKKIYRALKNVMKQKSEELILDKSFNKLVNYIKRKPSNSEQQVKELISCLLYKLGNSFGELSKIQKTQAVAQVIRFILKNKAFIALNSIKSKQHEGISIKKCIKDIKEFEEYNTHFNADGVALNVYPHLLVWRHNFF